jgi:hypothetical protein
MRNATIGLLVGTISFFVVGSAGMAGTISGRTQKLDGKPQPGVEVKVFEIGEGGQDLGEISRDVSSIDPKTGDAVFSVDTKDKARVVLRFELVDGNRSSVVQFPPPPQKPFLDIGGAFGGEIKIEKLTMFVPDVTPNPCYTRPHCHRRLILRRR